MRWWLRAHRAGALLGMVVGLGCFAWVSASGLAFDGSIASPVRAGSAVPLALWLPLGLVAALCWSSSVDDTSGARGVAKRSNSLLLVGFVVAVVVTSLAALIPAMVDAPQLMTAVARNIVGLVGLAMLAQRRLGAAGASAVTAAYLVIAALLGARTGGSAAWWAWPVAERLDAWGVFVAVSLLLGSLARIVHAGTASPRR